MATINGVELTGFNLRVASMHRNEMIDIPGTDTNYITDMGYDGLVLRLEGFETTLADYDAVIAEFMKSGAQTLVVRTGWQYSVYSAQLTPELLDSYPDTYFPYDLLLYTTTPYRESTLLSSLTKEITANNQEWVFEDIPSNNLLDNWRFDNWSDGTSLAPDAWVKGSATVIARDTGVIGDYCSKVTNGASLASVVQYILNYSKFNGKSVTISLLTS